MNDFEKARAFICDKNNGLSATSRKTGIPRPTLKRYRSDSEAMKKAAWERVHELAGLYDKK
ncbi:hypothetical protein [Limosilactobacillus antri]|uniref:hypothetical protein n=1 Tax=Limosilactobacillus antri TaxID=227943 RepID=UPI001F5669EF|nr:hypothetical protein [Limosilactobacillus antri]